MADVATIPEVTTQWPEPPRLLVEWSSPWQEFKSAFRPALTRSPKPLAGEAPIGMFPYRGMLASWLLEILLLIAVIVLPERFVSLELPLPPAHPQQDVIYYSGNELPQTQDRGGAQSGKSGRAGGQQAHHHTQTIRVARGDQPRETVVDAPKLNLPHSDSAVANLLAFKPNPGPPPAEGLRSSLTAPLLPAMSPVPPAPEVNSALNPTHSRTPNNLATSIVAPAPDVSPSSTRTSPALNAEIVPPTPNISRDKMRTANPLAPTIIGQTIIAPAPRETQRDLASSRVPLAQTVDVVAPPVSAPPRDLAPTHRLSLPAPAIVAPPPSQVSRDLNSWGSSATGDLRTNPVPPPPTTGGGSSGRLGTNSGTTLGTQVVPPPASISGQGSSGNGGGRAGHAAGSLLGSADVIPPPPGLGGGKALSGSGRGNKGAGTGGPLDLGSSVAPPSNAGGNATGNGIIVSSQPGSQPGLPNSGAGAIAMSPSGTSKSGLGGSGGGSGIGRGNGPGSGLGGEGTGAGKEGTGRGSDPNARGGISQYPGPGGAGNGTTGSPAMPGVSVEGGTTTITLPSFGAPGGDAPATGPGHSSVNDRKRSGVTVVATSRSGGVLPYYGLLKGDNYSIYINTSVGQAVMQYSDPSSVSRPSREALSEPEPLRKDLPGGLRPTRVVFTGILDRTGVLKDLRVLDPGAADTTSKILSALPKWKFRPAFRGDEPVEVTAIIGFGIDTR